MTAIEQIRVISHKLKGRESSFSIYAVLALNLLFTLFPTFMLTSCRKDEPLERKKHDNTYIQTEIYLKGTEKQNLKSLDIFVFNDNSLRRLDSYQRIDGEIEKTVNIASRQGSKIIVAIANAAKDRFVWAGINSYDSLKKILFSLKDEDPDSPIMTFETSHNAVAKGSCEIRLQPFLAEIVLKSICCDFSSRPYSNKNLENVKVYLTNVSASCPAIYDKSYKVTEIINYSSLSKNDFKDFIRPDIIEQKFTEPIGSNVIQPEIKLYCYPNLSEKAGLGSPMTRLVIEGRIDGKVYYYPIDINRQEDNINGKTGGIDRNTSYIFDILITRLGAKSPDTPIESGAIEVKIKIKDWKEFSNEIISYKHYGFY